MRIYIALLLVLAACGGCWVPQDTNVPVPATRQSEPTTDTPFWQYVPEGYTADRQWPLVVTLHGTNFPAYDTYDKQINEWKLLAEQQQFIVVAPKMRSVQGILPRVESIWMDDLKHDEKVILSLIKHMSKTYSIDRSKIMLTGFSSGGFPLYWTGLRNPNVFNAIVARACNSSMDIFGNIEVTEDLKKTPILVYWGKDDFRSIQKQSWQAFRFLRERGCKLTERKEFRGGHIRRPDIAYDFWTKCPPKTQPDK